jgi:branched-chain amino acid transport system permease protein
MVAFLQQFFNGLVSGAFLALLALGLSVIFGMLRVVNFAHGAFYMLGAFGAYLLLAGPGVNFWVALVLVPLGLAVLGTLVERLLVRWVTGLDPLYSFLLTFGLTLVLQGLMFRLYGNASRPYAKVPGLPESVNFGVFDYPGYQVFVFAASALICVAVWFLLARTRIGMVVRASTERPELTRALGINVGRWVTPVFGFGIGLAGLAGVLAAPMRAINPLMGADLIIVVFAVVVIGGLGSILGSVLAGFGLGVASTLCSLYAPGLSNTIVFIIMAVVLLWRPAGLFGREENA